MRVKRVIVSGLVLLFAACTPIVIPDVVTDDGGLQYGETAIVESVDVLVLESFPVKVRAIVNGDLPDGCTEITEMSISRTGETFEVKITTSHPIAAVCTDALKPFQKSLSLDVLDLPAGTYTVDAYGKTAVFTLAVKNSGTPYCECGGFSVLLYGNSTK